MEVRHVTLSVDRYNELILADIKRQFPQYENVRIWYNGEQQWYVTFTGDDPQHCLENDDDPARLWAYGEFDVDNGEDDRIHFSGPFDGMDFHVALDVVDDTYRPAN